MDQVVVGTAAVGVTAGLLYLELHLRTTLTMGQLLPKGLLGTLALVPTRGSLQGILGILASALVLPRGALQGGRGLPVLPDPPRGVRPQSRGFDWGWYSVCLVVARRSPLAPQDRW